MNAKVQDSTRRSSIRYVWPDGAQAEPSPSVGDVIDDLLESLEDDRLRDPDADRLTPDAARELHWCLDGQIRLALEAQPLSTLSTLHLQDLLDDLADAGFSSHRQRTVADALSALCRHAVKKGLLTRDLADGVAVPDDPGAESGPDAKWNGPTVADRVLGLGVELATVAVGLVAVVLVLGSV